MRFPVQQKMMAGTFVSAIISSTILLKACAAVSAGNGNPSLSPGNPELLAATGTFEVAVVFVPANGTLKAKPLDHWTCGPHKFCVFFSSGLIIPGKHPEQAPEHQQERDPVQQLKSGKYKHQIQN